jgi:SagB-type dehydrogenase family enzyme
MRRPYYWIIFLCPAVILTGFGLGCNQSSNTPSEQSQEQSDVVILPEPRNDSDVSVEQSMLLRRSIRSFPDKPLTLQEVSQLLWAAQGITDTLGRRTAPSAGALYPLEIYVVANKVQDLSAGVYHYVPEKHQIVRVLEGDIRLELYAAALVQHSVEDGAVVFIFTAVYERTTVKYGDRGIRYVHLEAGHAAQNLCLQATAMDLGAVTIGAFSDEQVAEVLNLPEDEQPLYLIPVGKQ